MSPKPRMLKIVNYTKWVEVFWKDEKIFEGMNLDNIKLFTTLSKIFKFKMSIDNAHVMRRS